MDLGRLERIDPRMVWATEGADFTPWLARTENIALLGETIGLELEVEAQEKNVGPFRADILCKETTTSGWVLIENQLERTDHTHLGQLLTYAAGLDAVTIVWIAQRFTEEHRATLDWLNEITDERFNFFGLEVELWRIGNSPAAPKFNIVSKPNDWTKRVAEAARSIESEAPTETKQQQLQYWTKFVELIRDKTSLRSQKPAPQHWLNLAIGRANFYLSASVNSLEDFVVASLILDGPNARGHFRALARDKEAIERELGFPLEWREVRGSKSSQMAIRLNAADPTNESEWDRQMRWLREHLEALHRVFAPRIKNLQPVSDPLEATAAPPEP
jgi:Domain of unknown function (DUF4268)